MIDLTSWQWTYLALPQAIAAVLTLIASRLVRPHRDTAIGANWLYILLLSEVLWSASGALEFCAANLQTKIFISQISYVGIALGPLAIIHFVHTYTHGGARLPRTASLFYTALTTLIIIGALTNPWHHQLWPDVLPVERDGLLHANYQRGPVFWLTVAYCYVTMAVTSGLLIRHTLRIGGVFSRQSVLILLATASPWLTSLIYILRIGPAPELDHTPVGFAMTGLLLCWAVLRLRLFDLVPISANTLFDRIPDPVLVIDADGRLVRANTSAHKTFGFSNRQFGQPLPKVLDHFPALTEQLFAHNEPLWKGEVQEESNWWSVESSLIDAGFKLGSSRGRLILLRDITARKQAQTQLAETLERADRLRAEAEAANAAKGDFLAQVSHDLRTPLHAIIGFSELLLSGEKLDPAQRAEVNSIHDAGSILQRLINDLLDLSRIDAGHIDLADTSFCLDDVVDPVLDLLVLTARAKQVSLELNISPHTPAFLHGDSDRLRQVLFNLIGNSVKFTASGRVWINISKSAEDTLQIEVNDTGPGILPDQLEHLFEPFIRGGKTVRAIEGTGLGLAISRRIVRAMGGDISVESTLGKGSTFTVSLPCRPAEPDDSWTSLHNALKGRTVTIVVEGETRSRQIGDALLAFGLSPQAAQKTGHLKDRDLVVGDDSVPPGERDRLHFVPLFDHVTATTMLKRRRLARALLPPLNADRTAESERYRLHVLIADDNLVNRKVGAAMLARNGCTVVAVNGGIEALARLQQETFDLVVLDGQMDDLNGWEVAERIRAGQIGEALRNIPIIALSADLTPASRALWSKAGVEELLGKPVRNTELVASLARVQPIPAEDR